LILIDALSSTCWKKKKKEKKKKWPGGFFLQGEMCLAGCTMWDFHGC
jgi:hypothetical protein